MIARRLMAASRGALEWYRDGSAPAPIAVYQPIGAASLEASYVNLANPGTFDAAPGVAPTFSAVTGWEFDGATQFLRAPVVLQKTYTLIVRYADAVEADGIAAGSFLSNRQFRIRPISGTSLRCYFGNSSPSIGYQMVSGIVCMASNVVYVNGALRSTLSDTWSGTNIESCGLGARSNGTFFQACNIQAVAIYSSTLTAPQVAAVSAAMAAL